MHPNYRKQGVGKILLAHVEHYTKAYFQPMTLFIDTENVSKFCLAYEYQYDALNPKITHIKYLI
ncbi:GNAT family N-acetyltransferase [Acinetobacter sp. ANC 3832]|uniref:GNAT family N-acetyltransferase n=1 Tax=Acinetobacter sp. ANC 3832 TaxID=1977874 RepID=UPI003A0FD13C